MTHDLFDTCVTYKNGQKMHFDVLLPTGQGKEQAHKCAFEWLNSIDVDLSQIDSYKFYYCHNAITKPQIENVIQQQGYAIIKSKGCPGYYC